MSTLGKGLFYFALVGALVAAVFGYMLTQKYQTTKGDVVRTQDQLTTAKNQKLAADKKADEATADKDKATAALTEANNKVDDLNGKLSGAQKAQDDLNTQLTAAKTDADNAKKSLQHVVDVLGKMSPEDAVAAIAKAQSDMNAAVSQQKVLEDKLQAQDKQVVDLKDAINRRGPGTQPPGITGKITFVNRAWNFVVLNIGLTNGVVPNGELIVYRGRNFLGKLKVTSAEDGTAVADILPDAKADIQIGDDVLN